MKTAQKIWALVLLSLGYIGFFKDSFFLWKFHEVILKPEYVHLYNPQILMWGTGIITYLLGMMFLFYEKPKPMKKKGQGISINTIIVAAIALLVLVILSVVFTGRIMDKEPEEGSIRWCIQNGYENEMDCCIATGKCEDEGVSYVDMANIPVEQEEIKWNGDENCVDYNNLNYTTLGINRSEFEKLECYRQLDWIRGWCFPSDCDVPNPPVCTAIYAVACYNPNSQESKYFNNIWINESLTKFPMGEN